MRAESSQQVALHTGLNAHARLMGSMESAKGQSAEEWAARLGSSGRLQGRSGGVDPMISRHLDLAVHGASDAQLKKAAKQWVDLNSQPGGPMESFSAEEREQAAKGAELFLRDRRQLSGPRLFKPTPGRALPSPGSGAELNTDAVAAWHHNAMRELNNEFEKAGLDPQGSARECMLYRTASRQIDAAAEVYSYAMTDLDEIPGVGMQKAYLDHLAKNPGDLFGAYQEIASELARHQGSEIHDQVNSFPSWWPWQ